MYEDEAYYIKEYIDAIKSKGFVVQIFGRADEFLKRAEENIRNIQLFIIDFMVFGPGNEFEGKSNGGARSGLLLLDEIEKLENTYPEILPKPKIVFTNRLGPVFEQAKGDNRITIAIKKSSVLPSEFVKIVKEVIEK
jgi:hypothetical protein